MNHSHISLAFALAIVGTACTQRTVVAPLSDTDALPLLSRELLAPIAELSKFNSPFGDSYNFADSPVRQAPKDNPFATDAEAVAAARDWISAHFGQLPPEVTLEPTTIDHSSSGHPAPVYDWDRGHTIVFQELYRGIPTSAGAVIYITGKTSFQATSTLYRYTPIAGTERHILSAKAARGIWREVFTKSTRRVLTPEEPAQFDAAIKPHLVYVWSPAAATGHSTAPTWAIDADNRIMIDAQTGKPWEND